MMKKTLLATAMLAGSTAALAEFSGNVAVVSDYLFRGISQSGGDAAIQGGLDYNHASGFYAGIWGSSIDFLATGPTMELDYYAGLGGDITEGGGFDVGAIYYDYPGDNTSGVVLEYWEVYGSVSGDVGPLTLTGNVAYSPDFFAESDSALYLGLGAEVGVAEGVTLSANVGHQSIDDESAFGIDPEDSYIHWDIGVSTSYAGLDFGLTYSDTDLSDSDCFGGTNLCDTSIWFSIGKSM